MKLDIAKTKYCSIHKQNLVKNNKLKQSTNIKNFTSYPKDIVSITGIKKYIKSTDGREVEIKYLHHNKKVLANLVLDDGKKIEIKDENLPEDLRKINTPEVFNAFVRDIYIKVTLLSNGEYKLYLNQKLLGGSKEYLTNILKLIGARFNQKISSQKVFEGLGVDYRKYSEVDDAILVEAMKSVAGFILTSQDIIENENDDTHRARFKCLLDKCIYLQQEELIKEGSYELLFHLSRGLEALKSKIFNKEDPFTIHAVQYFFNSVGTNKASDIEIKGHLKNEKFVCYIYVNLYIKKVKIGKEKFINAFKEFEMQKKPTDSERDIYKMPKGGICHGSCLVSATLEGNAFKNRNEILNKSSLLQQEYHKVRNPQKEDEDNKLTEEIIKIIHASNMDNLPNDDLIKKMVILNSTNLIEFLEENQINYFALRASSRRSLQEQALQNSSYKELQTFNNSEFILNDSIFDSKSFDEILNFLNNKISVSTSQKKHLILITLEEKTDISKAMETIEKYRIPQTHDILIRVDTSIKKNISQVIFSDLQEIGLYRISFPNLTEKIIALLTSYTKNFALDMFDKISAKYITENNSV